jgi:hypothetical protein
MFIDNMAMKVHRILWKWKIGLMCVCVCVCVCVRVCVWVCSLHRLWEITINFFQRGNARVTRTLTNKKEKEYSKFL